MNIIHVCEQCGAEQASWMGGSHVEANKFDRNGAPGCFDTRPEDRWPNHFLVHRIAYWKAGH